jgi:hypothetical protein
MHTVAKDDRISRRVYKSCVKHGDHVMEAAWSAEGVLTARYSRRELAALSEPVSDLAHESTAGGPYICMCEFCDFEVNDGWELDQADDRWWPLTREERREFRPRPLRVPLGDHVLPLP